MNGSEARRGRWATLVVLLVMAALLSAPTSFAQEEEAGDWNQVTVLYLSDVHGKIDPCG